MMKMLTRFILPVLIVAAGVAGAVGLKYASTRAKRQPTTARAPAVEVVRVEMGERPVWVDATGVVTAARRVQVFPEVGGRIVAISDRLVPGGRFNKGEVLARLDKRDYELLIGQERSRVRQAELELQLESGRGDIAAREWKLLGKNPEEQGPALALRTPQLETARENVQAAKSGLKRAELSKQRTVLTAPFNAVVLEKRVDLGQLVGPNTAVATLVGTDQLWVTASVPMEKLTVIDIPGLGGETGSAATVTHRLATGIDVKREGRVLRLQGELDSLNRTARLLLVVDDPYSGDEGELPLLPGAYVEVQIRGRAMSGVVALPRAALFENDEVWVVDDESRLRRREIEIAWRSREHVLIKSGVETGERVVTSPLSLPIDGMTVSVPKPRNGPKR
jgi:RND family efflux transporter MFP subunit